MTGHASCACPSPKADRSLRGRAGPQQVGGKKGRARGWGGGARGDPRHPAVREAELPSWAGGHPRPHRPPQPRRSLPKDKNVPFLDC